jgi:hypothetical protein
MESMQKYCLKQMCGVLPSTKYESVLLALGVKSMSARANQLKLNFFNKIKQFPEDFYVRRALVEQFNGEAIDYSFSSGIRGIFAHYTGHDSYDTWLSEYETLEASLTKKMFKSLVIKVCDTVDFEHCHQEAGNSALRSTGQARLIHTGTQFLNCHNSVLQVFSNPLWTPSERTGFLQTFLGCDFLTPFNHRIKPACKFCWLEGATWPHLLLSCPCALVAGQPAIIREVLNFLEGENAALGSIFRDTNDHDNLFLLLMGILQSEDHFGFAIKWKRSLYQVTKITAQYIQRIHSEWTDINDSDSDSGSVSWGDLGTPLIGSAGGGVSEAQSQPD